MPTPMTNIHDAFFKKALSDPRLAGILLCEHLPREVVNQFDLRMPEPLPASFVDESLQQHHADLLFRVPLRNGDDALAFMLLEHKSSYDRAAPLQLLRYLMHVLVNWHRGNERRLPLPPVMAVLVYQGPQPWRGSGEFAELFGTVAESLRPYLPSFRYVLVDLSTIKDQTLSTQVRLRAFLKALKYARREDLSDRFEVLLADAAELESDDLKLILTYLNDCPIAADKRRRLRETLQRVMPGKTEDIMGWITQPEYDRGKSEGFVEGRHEGRQEGREEGRWEGRQDGVVEGAVRALTRLLEKRFSTIPLDLRQRILNADTASIETWIERAVEAPDVHAVFEIKS